MSNPRSYLVEGKHPGSRISRDDDDDDLVSDRRELRQARGPSTQFAKTEVLGRRQFDLAERNARDQAAVESGLPNNRTNAQIRYELQKKMPRDNGLYTVNPPPNPLDDPRENSRMMFSGRYRTNNVVDPHEILKAEMFRSDIKSDANHFERSRPGNVMYGVADRYIVLDSGLKSLGSSNPATGTYAFNFMIQGISGDQNIGVSDKLENVTEIQVAPFYIQTPLDNPYITNPTGTNMGLPVLTGNGGAPPAGTLSQTPYAGKVTIELKELGRQFISDSLNRRHHFEFTSTPQSNGTTLLTPEEGLETFIFTDPVSAIHGLTLAFRNPFQSISFLPDTFTTPALSAIVGAGQLLTFQFANHGLAVNNLIFVQNFNSGNPVLDNYVNSVQGLAVGVGGLTANQFRLNPDIDVSPLGLLVGATIPVGSVSITVAYRRFRLPMRLRSMVSRLTNYILPG